MRAAQKDLFCGIHVALLAASMGKTSMFVVRRCVRIEEAMVFMLVRTSRNDLTSGRGQSTLQSAASDISCLRVVTL
eukprot:2248945-Amphidinium_carterae.1